MRVCIIGGTGHIGSHLVPMFAQDGFDVTVVSRGQSPLPGSAPWERVNLVRADYSAAHAGWKQALRDAAAEADVVIDLLGIDLAGCYEAVRDSCGHVIACGSLWMLGMPRHVPTPAQSQSDFWGEAYLRRWKVIQEVLQRSASGGLLFTAILPPNICGPGKIPLETRGGRSIDVHRDLAAGQTVILPEGADVLIGPCDAEDVAQAFFLAAKQPARAAGKILNAGSAYALTASEFVATYGDIYGAKIPIRRVSWNEFAQSVVPDPGARYHFEAHMCPDIGATRTLLGYEPRYTPEQTMQRAVEWMRSRKLL